MSYHPVLRNLDFSFSRTLVGVLALVLTTLLSVPAGLAQSGEYKAAFSAYQQQDFETAAEIWRKLAEKGDFNAQYALGVMELRGETENSSNIKAFYWFKQAASAGHATAMFNVGVAYWEGSGVEQDRDLALQWWERSALAGDVGAQFNLGLAYYIGEERPVDLKEAEKWIRMAANQNHPEAKRILKILAKGEQEIPQTKITTAQSAGVSGSSSGQQDEQSTASSTSASSEQVDDGAVKTYWKTSGITPLQSNPDSSGIEFTTLPAGIPVEVIASSGDWSNVTLPGGIKTWIFEDFLDISGASGVIKGEGVRVRPLPSTNNSISPPIGAYKNGEKVTVLEKKGQWYQIRAPKHIGGWTSTSNIENYQDTKKNRDELWKRMVANGL